MLLVCVSCGGAWLQSGELVLELIAAQEGQERPFPAVLGSLSRAGAAGGIYGLFPALLGSRQV